MPLHVVRLAIQALVIPGLRPIQVAGLTLEPPEPMVGGGQVVVGVGVARLDRRGLLELGEGRLVLAGLEQADPFGVPPLCNEVGAARRNAEARQAQQQPGAPGDFLAECRGLKLGVETQAGGYRDPLVRCKTDSVEISR